MGKELFARGVWVCVRDRSCVCVRGKGESGTIWLPSGLSPRQLTTVFHLCSQEGTKAPSDQAAFSLPFNFAPLSSQRQENVL